MDNDFTEMSEELKKQKETGEEIRFDIDHAIFYLKQIKTRTQQEYLYSDEEKKEMRKHLEYALERLALAGGNLQ